jgi:hypothetical protein
VGARPPPRRAEARVVGGAAGLELLDDDQRHRRRRIYAALEAEGVPPPADGTSFQVLYAAARDHRSLWHPPFTAVGYLYREAEAWVFQGRSRRGGDAVRLRFTTPLSGLTFEKSSRFLLRATKWLRIGDGDDAHHFTAETGVTALRSLEVTQRIYDHLARDAPPPEPGAPEQ